MDSIMLLILSLSLIGIVVILGLSQFKIENNVSGHFDGANHNFDAFVSKIKSSSSRIRR